MHSTQPTSRLPTLSRNLERLCLISTEDLGSVERVLTPLAPGLLSSYHVNNPHLIILIQDLSFKEILNKNLEPPFDHGDDDSQALHCVVRLSYV